MAAQAAPLLDRTPPTGHLHSAKQEDKKEKKNKENKKNRIKKKK
jgi:hypothetical protein